MGNIFGPYGWFPLRWRKSCAKERDRLRITIEGKERALYVDEEIQEDMINRISELEDELGRRKTHHDRRTE